MHLGARIDQERQALLRRLAPEVRVMQDGTVFVQRNDVRIGQLIVGVINGPAVGAVNVEFRTAIPECGFGGDVTGGSAIGSQPRRSHSNLQAEPLPVLTIIPPADRSANVNFGGAIEVAPATPQRFESMQIT